MKILFWNCRGIGNAQTESVLRNFCTTYTPNLVGIAEPMVDFSSLPYRFWFSLNLELVAVNNRPLPTLWVLRQRNSTTILKGKLDIYTKIKCHFLILSLH